MNVELVLFWGFASLSVICGLFVIGARNPIHSAMALVGTFFFLAGTYVLLWAHTIAVFQVLVYAGAIMVLFLFVIMLLSLTDAQLGSGGFSLSRVVGGLCAVAFLVALVAAIRKSPLPSQSFSAAQEASFGTLQWLGQALYTRYLLPFEAVSLLLLVAIVGAVVVAKARI